MSTVDYQPNLSFDYKESKLFIYSIIFLIIIIIFGCFSIPYFKLRLNIQKLQVQQDIVTQEYNTKLSTIDIKPINLDLFKEELISLSTEVKLLENDNYKLNIDIFKNLEAILPKNTWLTEFDFNTDIFYIKGNAMSLSSIDVLFYELLKIRPELQLKTTLVKDMYEFEIKKTKKTK